MPPPKSRAEILSQRKKLTQSYQELLDQFSSKDLSTVGNYALGRLIGKGSFGKVYLASHKLIRNSKVVLKSANKNDSNLAREIHHHRQFLHPHIARLYEVIVTESLVWLVLEYCPGDELYNYLLQHGRLQPAQVQKIFTQLVGAVTYVHNMSCVHRDLKLENILLDKNGNVKLCDFGFTREYEGKASYLQTFCGTVCYSAPEMLRGEKYAGEKVDVWSLGVILYALLAGELPYDEDDDNATKMKILTMEPQYPDHIPADAKSLISSLLSKRPLLRPSLSDILAHPFLSEHAPQQHVILKIQPPAPFTTQLEKETLQRMRSAGVDIDQVIENVLARRCDTLAGWWSLLIEKEEKKEKRRERKRLEREQEAKTLRRLSAASSRLDRMTPILKEVAEEGEHPELLSPDSASARGRQKRRSTSNPQKPSLDLPSLSEVPRAESPSPSIPPPPIEKDSAVVSRASSRQRPGLPPKELRRSRASTLQLVQANPDLLSPTGMRGRRKRGRHQHAILNQLASLKHWFMESTKRTKSPLPRKEDNSRDAKSSTTTPIHQRPSAAAERTTSSDTVSRPGIRNSATYPQRTTSLNAHTPRKPVSLSPAPLTPRSSLRRRSAGLRGRKSTSSSVSSIRSIHHHHTHSKASSTSSTSITSSTVAVKAARSPHDSIKVLPATPTTSTFPSNVRVVRGSSNSNPYNESAHFTPPGLVFAKRKKSPFRGPTLGLNTSGASSPSLGRMPRDSSLTRGVSGTGGRTSLEAIAQEEEDEEEEDVEEVDTFSPISEPGVVEETILEVERGSRDG